jgi:GTPase SAR1 family protein
VSPSSFANVKNKWINEIKENSPNVPILLVGTKIDLRDDESIIKELNKKNEEPITYEKGKELGEEIKAMYYIENSAKTQKGLSETFIKCVQIVLKPEKITITKTNSKVDLKDNNKDKNKKNCLIL